MLSLSRVKQIKNKLLDLCKEFELLEQEMEDKTGPKESKISNEVSKQLGALLTGAYELKRKKKNKL